MYKTASEKVEGLSEENTALYDVNLYYRTGEDEPWQEATEDNFPEEGITVTLPYPDGTNAADFDFVVTHMLTVAGKAGQVETPAVTKTEKGLQFTVHSLSPIAISWKAVPKATVTEDTVTENRPSRRNPSVVQSSRHRRAAASATTPARPVVTMTGPPPMRATAVTNAAIWNR